MIVLHTQIGPSQGTARNGDAGQAAGYTFRPGTHSVRPVELIEAVERVEGGQRFNERGAGALHARRRAPVTIDSAPISVEVLSVNQPDPDRPRAVAAGRSPATLATTPPGSPIAAYVAAFELIGGPPAPGATVNTTI